MIPPRLHRANRWMTPWARLPARAPRCLRLFRTPPPPTVLNGFLTWLNTVHDKLMGTVARAFHLMQLAGFVIPSFPHDSMPRQWDKLLSSLPLTPQVSRAISEFVKAHPQELHCLYLGTIQHCKHRNRIRRPGPGAFAVGHIQTWRSSLLAAMSNA